MNHDVLYLRFHDVVHSSCGLTC